MIQCKQITIFSDIFHSQHLFYLFFFLNIHTCIWKSEREIFPMDCPTASTYNGLGWAMVKAGSQKYNPGVSNGGQWLNHLNHHLLPPVVAKLRFKLRNSAMGTGMLISIANWEPNTTPYSPKSLFLLWKFSFWWEAMENCYLKMPEILNNIFFEHLIWEISMF